MQRLQAVAKLLPRPGQIPVQIRPNLRVLLLSDAINSLTRRVENELTKHKAVVQSVQVSHPDDMTVAVNNKMPDIVVCPFLKTRVPTNLIGKTVPILIMHPGIAGDRGASSIDWALLERKNTWGVTVLEAAPEVDAGDIWSTEEFFVPNRATKTSVYTGPVSDSAVRCITDAVTRFCSGLQPVCQENHPEITGCFKRNMKHSDRLIDWSTAAEKIETRIRMSDTSPGALAEITTEGLSRMYRLFDGHIEKSAQSRQTHQLLKDANPGQPVARRNKSVLVKAGDENGVWIGQMKENSQTSALKLPTLDKLPNFARLPVITDTSSCDDIRVIQSGLICYVMFDFYNGAMDTEQAIRLTKVLQDVDQNKDIQVVALMGGERFFSTGIHLCVIENSLEKSEEAWRNINGIDDVIKTIANFKNKVSVAVMRGNAGAGGAMLAAACDLTFTHPGVLITPSYKSMNLFGSEYWTYFLPQKIGDSLATKLTNDTNPISAEYATSIGLVDNLLQVDKADFDAAVKEVLAQKIKDGDVEKIIKEKSRRRTENWKRVLQEHRDFELSKMKECFGSRDFLNAMHDFVYKKQT